MEKNTVIAIVLSSIVLIVFMVVQGNRMQPPAEVSRIEQQAPDSAESSDARADSDMPSVHITEALDIVSEPVKDEDEEIILEDQSAEPAEQTITIRTNTITAVLTNVGGDMISWKLNDHWEDPNTKKENVDMIFRSAESTTRAFSIALGEDTQPVSNVFHVNRINEHNVQFYRDFITREGDRFRMTKHYEFKPNGYMFELTVKIDRLYDTSDFNYTRHAYTLSFGPQIGPEFSSLNRYDTREYSAYINGKRRNQRPNTDINDSLTWASISGKYFSFIAIPRAVSQYKIKFSDAPEPGIPTASRLNFIRQMNQGAVTDIYRFYLGPKSSDALNVYHTGVNDFQHKDSSLVDIASSGFWGLLVRPLKWLLLLCYRVVPNYGVAIILLTLLIKLLFFPLTRKSSEATLRMQELSPKIKELQEKYKDNPKKMNAEMALLYQKEGYNPLSGCLPMLLQIPIFIAMYQLFNNHFDLRGAGFIPGWIPDLSMPESIFDFPDGFRIPILGWEAIRALPFIYVASQLVYGKFTQNPGQQSGNQMKIMMYVMPIAFFFILYNVPSGLLIYWIFSNIFTLVQQVLINKYKHAKKAQTAQTAVEEQKTVIAPRKKKR